MIKIKDLDLLKNIDILYENEIILYGAGNYGEKISRLLNKIKISILGFCDSNAAKWGEVIEGHRVLSLYEMQDIVKEKQVIIIIAMADPEGVEQVLKLLERYGITETDCYTYFSIKYAIELHIDDDRIEESFRKEEKIKAKLCCDRLMYNIVPHVLSVIEGIVSKRGDILVLQPAKVGSSSVYHSLEKAQVPCVHVHRLTGRWGVGNRSEVFDKTKDYLPLLKTEKVKIISLVRDPIARGLSVYFEAFHEYIARVYADCFEPDTYKGVISLLKDEMEKGICGAMFEWFNIEMKDSFGVDVYQYDFDREKGYQIIRKGNVELLLLKLEKLNDCEEMVGQFAGVDNFKLIKVNDANDKLYRFAYEELKKTIEIPQNILDFYYKDNPAMDHFYTTEEKERFYRKWSK